MGGARGPSPRGAPPGLVEQDGGKETENGGHSDDHHGPDPRTESAGPEGRVSENMAEVGKTREPLSLAELVHVVDGKPESVDDRIAKKYGAKDPGQGYFSQGRVGQYRSVDLSIQPWAGRTSVGQLEYLIFSKATYVVQLILVAMPAPASSQGRHCCQIRLGSCFSRSRQRFFRSQLPGRALNWLAAGLASAWAGSGLAQQRLLLSGLEQHLKLAEVGRVRGRSARPR